MQCNRRMWIKRSVRSPRIVVPGSRLWVATSKPYKAKVTTFQSVIFSSLPWHVAQVILIRFKQRFEIIFGLKILHFIIDFRARRQATALELGGLLHVVRQHHVALSLHGAVDLTVIANSCGVGARHWKLYAAARLHGEVGEALEVAGVFRVRLEEFQRFFVGQIALPLVRRVAS